MDALTQIRAIERQGSKTAFHRQTFDFLLALWNNRIEAPSARQCGDLVPVLARWLKEAPVADDMDCFRVLTARPVILSVLHSAGENIDGFLASALGPLDTLERIKPWARKKLALTASIDSRWVPDMEQWRGLNPEEAMTYAVASLLDEPIGEHGLIRFNGIIGAVPKLGAIRLPYRYFGFLAYASYVTSFATSNNKYAAKPVFAEIARDMLRESGIADDGETEKLKASAVKSRVVVITEHLQPGGVMLRCYGNVIASLKPHFEVILAAELPSKCPEHAELAHQQYYFEPDHAKLDKLVTAIRDFAPQAIFFPSVGMTWWTYALSLLRLAPLQAASIGHPSPVGSGRMDYLAVQNRIWSPEATALEATLQYESHPISMEPYVSAWFRDLQARSGEHRGNGQVRIAINASSMKLNAVFMSALRRIREEHGRNIRYRFFPHGAGIRHSSLIRRIQSWFPDAEVMAGAGYQQYMEWLAECDLMLQSFPFGGTNTTLDALALGMPVVCMDGPELHSRIDAALLEQTGLATELLASNPDDYARIAGKLIADADMRSRTGFHARTHIVQAMEQEPSGNTLGQALKKAVSELE